MDKQDLAKISSRLDRDDEMLRACRTALYTARQAIPQAAHTHPVFTSQTMALLDQGETAVAVGRAAIRLEQLAEHVGQQTTVQRCQAAAVAAATTADHCARSILATVGDCLYAGAGLDS